MDLATAAVSAQLAAFQQMVLSNPVIETIVERMPVLDVPGCYLAAGALTVLAWPSADLESAVSATGRRGGRGRSRSRPSAST